MKGTQGRTASPDPLCPAHTGEDYKNVIAPKLQDTKVKMALKTPYRAEYSV